MKIKFNWGFGILVTIVLFMGIILSIVLYMMNQDVDLVTDKYYDKEIKYQQQIDTEKRTNALGENIKVNILNNTLIVTFPDSSSIGGELYFYRPSDFKKDFKIPIKIDHKREQAINIGKVEKGYWRLKIAWDMNNDEYYSEKSIYIN